nr:MAG TPA: hypothetical protein [Caudoviricetes sp.]DAX22521.1 MAG TPA: hypothetical protein [Bacteriophage sp.]
MQRFHKSTPPNVLPKKENSHTPTTIEKISFLQ